MIESEWADCSNEEKFFILTCVEGNGTIEGEGFSEEIKMGDSYLIPATLGKYVVKGNVEVIKKLSNVIFISPLNENTIYKITYI